MVANSFLVAHNTTHNVVSSVERALYINVYLITANVDCATCPDNGWVGVVGAGVGFRVVKGRGHPTYDRTNFFRKDTFVIRHQNIKK